MNTQFITRASTATGKAVKKNRAAMAAGSLVAILASGGIGLADKWLDSRQKSDDALAVQQSIASSTKAVEDRLTHQIDQLKADQAAKDQAQWTAIGKKRDK